MGLGPGEETIGSPFALGDKISNTVSVLKIEAGCHSMITGLYEW